MKREDKLARKVLGKRDGVPRGQTVPGGIERDRKVVMDEFRCGKGQWTGEECEQEC